MSENDSDLDELDQTPIHNNLNDHLGIIAGNQNIAIGNQNSLVAEPVVYDSNLKLPNRKPIYKGIMNPLGFPKASYQKVVALSDLYDFCKHSRIDLLDQFQNCNLNLVLTPGDDSLLTIAAFNGSVVCFQYLLDVGVDINYRASDGVTALMACVYAVWSDRISQIVEKLLLAGADINIIDKHGLNAIQIAFLRRNSGFLKSIANFGISIGDCNVLGMKPIEYILTKVTDSSMDAILILLIENSIGDLFTQIPFLIHFLSKKNTPFLEQLLRKNYNSFIHESKNVVNVTNVVNAMGIAMDQDQESFNSQWLFSDSSDQSPIDLPNVVCQKNTPILNQNTQVVLKVDQYGLTPIHYAVNAGILGNVELLLDYGQVNLNLSIFRNLFDKMILASSIKMINLFLEYGAKFYPEREWLSWYLSHYNTFSLEMVNLIFYKTRFQHYRIQNISIQHSVGCTCTVFNYTIRHLLSQYLENLIININTSNRSSLDSNKCNYRQCYFYQQTPVHYFLHRLSSCEYKDSPMDFDVFRILFILIRYNFITIDDINLYDWTHIYDPKFASLLEEYNLIHFGNLFSNNPYLATTGTIRKWLICHSKNFKYTPRNTEEYGTFESIADIPYEDFFLTESGIIWSYENLYQYLFNIVRGVNAYDASSPWAGEPILSNRDFTCLVSNENPFAKKIYNYMSVSKYLEFLPTTLLEQLYHIGQVFSAKGNLFEKDLALILAPAEVAEWADVRNFKSTNAMPKLSHDLLIKINKMKEDTMAILFSLYGQLSPVQIDVLSQLNPELNPNTFQKLFNGEFCTMTMGSYLTKLYKSLTKWM
jgi:ankyrin repeat protein